MSLGKVYNNRVTPGADGNVAPVVAGFVKPSGQTAEPLEPPASAPPLREAPTGAALIEPGLWLRLLAAARLARGLL